jgi:hypothetical protein
MTDYLLDFLLVVETMNHEIIKQSPDDKSKKGGSSFIYDVKDLPLRRASLIGKGHLFMVDLIDGHIEVDGRSLYPPKEPPIGSKFKLLYYRSVQRKMAMSSQVQKGFLGLVTKITGVAPQAVPVVRYYIGWQIEGTNKKWEMGID